MGGSSSSERKITIEEGDNGITLSDSVQKRILGLPETTEGKATDTKKVTGTVSEDDLIKMQRNYEDRLQSLHMQNENVKSDLKYSFERAVEEVEQKFLKTTACPVCEDLQQEVLQCYKKNSQYPLECNAIVRAYAECVSKQRETILNTANRKGS